MADAGDNSSGSGVWTGSRLKVQVECIKRAMTFKFGEVDGGWFVVMFLFAWYSVHMALHLHCFGGGLLVGVQRGFIVACMLHARVDGLGQRNGKQQCIGP